MTERWQHARETRRWRFGLGLATMLMLVLAGCGGGGGESPDAEATAIARLSEGMEGLRGGIPTTVAMTEEQQFQPAQLTVPVGTTVLWTNTSTEAHTVTASPAQAKTASNVQVPAGAEPFASESVPPGETFSQQLTVAGTYRYVCRIHENAGMVGTITVE